jgi:mRNA-degrading endonuclease toxin of MazEF toxin-antitoxin module
MFSFPKPDKKRPVLVLTRQDMIGRLQTVTVVPITSTAAVTSIVWGASCMSC